MPFLKRVLHSPSYGYLDQFGGLSKPTPSKLLGEFFERVNPFIDKKNWLTFTGWFTSLLLTIPFFIFLFRYFSWPLLVIGMLYSMVGLGTYGTVWFHRYATHKAFKFRNPFVKFLFRNLVIKIVPEEIYVVSHHVHHRYVEEPGDPYNVFGGWLYCFLADANHQPIARGLTIGEYDRVVKLIDDTGVHANSHEQYLKWGSICHPLFTLSHYLLNWIFWYSIFFLVGGHALATAIFGMSAVWAFGIRTFNYDGHGGGKDKRKKGIDFNRNDLSINQLWPGFVAGEWHNNHHLYPGGARSGFLPYQVDGAWMVIKGLSFFGVVTSYRDYKSEFLKKYADR